MKTNKRLSLDLEAVNVGMVYKATGYNDITERLNMETFTFSVKKIGANKENRGGTTRKIE